MKDRQVEIPSKPYSRAEFEQTLQRDYAGQQAPAPKIDPEARLTVNQAASLLGVSRRTLYNYDGQGLVKIEHDGGKPFVKRGSIDAYLDAKNAGIKKTEYVPDGCVVIKEEAWHKTRQVAEDMTVRVASLTAQVQNLLTYEKQVEEDAAEIARLKAENDRLKSRGFWDRVFNRGVNDE